MRGKFGMRDRTCGLLMCAKFPLVRYVLSSRRGEKSTKIAQFRSNFEIGACVCVSLRRSVPNFAWERGSIIFPTMPKFTFDPCILLLCWQKPRISPIFYFEEIRYVPVPHLIKAKFNLNRLTPIYKPEHHRKAYIERDGRFLADARFC